MGVRPCRRLAQPDQTVRCEQQRVLGIEERLTAHRIRRDDLARLRERLLEPRFAVQRRSRLEVPPPPGDIGARLLQFVSRAPQRRNGGAAHKDTIYGQPE